MKHALLLLLLLVAAFSALAQQPLYFPPTTGPAWATTSPQSLGWCQPRVDSLLNFLGRKGTKSFIILKDGRLVVEQYYGTYTQDSVWYWASASKALTATLVGLAHQEGRVVSLDDSVSRYLGRGWTSTTSAQERRITVRHLLTMTSGLDDTPPAPCENETIDPACLLYQAPAGRRWAYHTGAYRRLLEVVAKASSLSINQYTNQKLAERIGMRGLWVNGVYYSRARDMARFGLLTLANGQWNSLPVLTDASYRQQMLTSSQEFNPAYGYLWWLNGQTSYKLPGPQQTVFPGALIPSAPADLVAALGKNDQKIYVAPSQGLVVVRQGNSAGSPRLALSSFDTELWRYISALGCPPTAVRPSAPEVAWHVAPNPAAGTVYIHWTTPPPAGSYLQLSTPLGQVLRRVPATSPTLVLPNVAAGLYLVGCFAPDGRSLGRQHLLVQ